MAWELKGRDKRKLSPVKSAILKLLSDGMPHYIDDICEQCLSMGYCGEGPKRVTLQMHVCVLNKKLASKGERIVLEHISNRPHYRHVRLLVGGD